MKTSTAARVSASIVLSFIVASTDPTQLAFVSQFSQGPPALSPSSGSPTFLVTSGEDSGPGTLREAIERINAEPIRDSVIDIHVAPAVEVVLSTQLAPQRDVRIVGATERREDTVIRFEASAAQVWTLLEGRSAAVSLENLTLDGGGHFMTGISVSSSTTGEPLSIVNAHLKDWDNRALSATNISTPVHISHSLVSSKATTGGATGIDFYGINDPRIRISDTSFSGLGGWGISLEDATFLPDSHVRITHSDFSKNGFSAHLFEREVAAIVLADLRVQGTLHEAPVTVSGSSFSENQGSYVGAIAAEACTESALPCVSITQSSFVGNSGEFGSDLLVAPGPDVGYSPDRAQGSFAVENSTFVTPLQTDPDGAHDASGARAPFFADEHGSATATFDHVSVVGGGFALHGHPNSGVIGLRNTVIDSGAQAPVWISFRPEAERESTRITSAYGRFTAATPFIAGEHNGVVESAALALGGPALNENTTNGTLTVLPASGSVLIDAAGPVGSTPAVDQRGLPRPSGGASDIGAAEVQQAPAPISTLSVVEDVRVQAGEPAVFRVTRSGESGSPVRSIISTRDGTAIAGRNYTQHSIVLAWEADDMSDREFSVQTTVHGGHHTDLVFTAELSEASEGAVVSEGSRSGTITAPQQGSGGGDGDARDGADPDLTSTPTPPLARTGGAPTAVAALAGMLIIAIGAAMTLRRRGGRA